MTKPDDSTTSPAERPRGGRILRSPFILAILSVVAFFWVVTGAVIAIDPLDLYDWGEPPRLLPDYNRHTNREMYMVAARADVDVLLLSSSTLAAITSDEMEKSFGVEKAFNFAVSGPRPADRRFLLEQVAAHSPAERVIVSFDYLFVLPPDYASDVLPAYLYDDNPLNDLRIASPEVLRLTWQKLKGEPIGLPGWEYSTVLEPERQEYAAFQQKLAKERAEGRRRASGWTPGNASASQDCADYPLVSQILPELVDRMTARDKTVDFVIPPYSLRLYRSWQDYGVAAEVAMAEPFLPKQIAIRRCLVRAFAGRDHVRVFAFDNETWITGDLTNYRDEAHVQNPAIYRFILNSMARGSHRLTTGNFENYAATLTRNVERDALSEPDERGPAT